MKWQKMQVKIGMQKDNDKLEILGVGIDPIAMDEALQKLDDMILERKQNYVCVCSNHGIMESQKDDRLREIINSSQMATPDGMSIVWTCKLFGHSQVNRVCGTELMLAFSELSAKKGYTQFYYGGAEGVPEKLAENLCKKYPGLKVVGTYSPPFRPLTKEEDDAIVEMINELNPDVIWVGLGLPKQEFWINDHLGRINSPVMIGVGAAFDFISGKVKRAPEWMQRSGLEWLYRLSQEPKRLWKRNLYHPIFLYKVFLQRMGINNKHK